jgi:hypothetical protein
LFPYLSRVRAGDRATEFGSRFRQAWDCRRDVAQFPLGMGRTRQSRRDAGTFRPRSFGP